jgi:hypothetical protein
VILEGSLFPFVFLHFSTGYISSYYVFSIFPTLRWILLY